MLYVYIYEIFICFIKISFCDCLLLRLYIYINVLLSSRKVLLFLHWLIPKSCDGPHKITADPCFRLWSSELLQHAVFWLYTNISTLKMEAACPSKTLVYNQKPTQCNNPEDHHLNSCLWKPQTLHKSWCYTQGLPNSEDVWTTTTPLSVSLLGDSLLSWTIPQLWLAHSP
jgi:hypothetical protein